MNSKIKIETFEKNLEVISKAQAGDMLKFQRGLHSHWGIYTGNGEIIHRWDPNGDMSNAQVWKSKINDIMAYDGDLQIHNFLDDKKKPLPISVIVEKAENALGTKGYGLLDKNCEHFVTECRYGQATSRQ
ncbi:unnamed protein product, partial [Adineta steineri]